MMCTRSITAFFATVIFAAILFSFKVGATEIEVKLSPSIAQYIERLDAYERKQEAERRFFSMGRVPEGVSSDMRTAKRLTQPYALQRLIPEMDEFSIVTLTERMAAYNLEKTGLNTDDMRLGVEVDEFFSRGYEVAHFDGPNNVIKGSFYLYDENGRLVASEDVSAYAPTARRVSRRYNGDEHPFQRTGVSSIGILMARFLEKGMERIYDGTNMPGVVRADFRR